MNSPSPQTIVPGKRLYHSPSATSGSVSSQRASNINWSEEILRLSIRSKRCWKSAGGRLFRRILGMHHGVVLIAASYLWLAGNNSGGPEWRDSHKLDAIKATGQALTQTGCLVGVLRRSKSFCQQTEFFWGQAIAF
jgi:hypothetical protein